MTTLLFDLPPFERLQKLFKYASPVFVGADGNDSSSSSSPLWYLVLLSTRILLAHCTVMSDRQDTFLKMAAGNLRNLYRLYGIDLADKDVWSSVTSDASFYVPPCPEGKVWISPDYSTAVSSMQSVSFEDMRAGFVAQENKMTQDTFGHCIYKLVASRDTGWSTTMWEYRLLR